MTRRILTPAIILSALLSASCSNPSGPDDPPPAPSPVPLPTSVYDPVFMSTNVSAETAAGISEPIDGFEPFVLEMFDRTGVNDPNTHLPIYDWISKNQRMTLVENGSIMYLGSRGEVAVEAPRLKHTRYWRKVFSVDLGENTSFSEAHSVTYGISTTEGSEFGITVGLEVNAWFVTMKAEISASFSHEITNSSETSTEKTFSAQGSEGKNTVFTVWQLVDRFYLCDSEGNTLSEDKDALCNRLRLRGDKYYFEEASESEYYLSTVMFDK
jgi:hypothetical protein